jgi:signal transduction histidine kinase
VILSRHLRCDPLGDVKKPVLFRLARKKIKMKEHSLYSEGKRRFTLRGLRARVMILVLLPLVAILGTFMVMQYQAQQKAVLNNLAFLASQTGLTIQNSLAEAMLNHNQEELQQILNSIGKNQLLRSVYLLDTTGKVVFAPEGQGVGLQLTNLDAACQTCHRLPASQRPSSVVVTLAGGQRVFRTMNPIQNLPECQACHSPTQRLIGLLLTDISMQPLEASLSADLWLNFFWWIAAILVSAVVINLVVDRFVLSRMENLSRAIREIGSGQATLPLPENQQDEIGQVALAFNDMVRQIEKRSAENQQLSEDLQRQSAERGELLQRVITAQEDERKRVARELHDEFGQALAGLAFQTEATRNLIASDPEKAVAVLDQTQSLIQITTEQMYNMILALRPSVLDDLGLVAALRVHAERTLRDTGVAFSLESSCLTRRLPQELETVVYRIFQEALSNIMRHSGARNVSMVLALEEHCFRGEVQDDGQGFDPEAVRLNPDIQAGLGLLGMQERVTQYRGQVEIQSEPGRGTKIIVWIPLEEVDHGKTHPGIDRG